jgi:sugar phosphate isomerase/epimerase
MDDRTGRLAAGASPGASHDASRGAADWSRRDALRALAAGVVAPAALARALGAQGRQGVADGAATGADAVRDGEGSAVGAGPARGARIDRIGLQLYTVRRAMATDLEGTIAAVAAAGVREVEFAGYHDKPATWWRATLERHGLTSPSTHLGLPRTDGDWAPLLDQSVAMGHRWVIVPFVGAEFRGSRAAWQRLAARLNALGERCRPLGLRAGYHNHDFEFAPVEGTTGFDIIAAETDPTLVDLELDLYWTVKGGHDPLAHFARLPGRITCCHVKDAGPAPERAMRDVGAGTLDFKGILAAGRRAGLAHWFIEHDNPADPVASVRASAAAMQGY